MSTERLHLAHISTVVKHSDAQQREDLAYMLGTVKPDLLSMTEMAGSMDVLRSVCHNWDYTPVMYSHDPGEAFAIRNDTCKLKDKGEQPSYPQRSVCWIEVGWHGTRVFYHSAHWEPNPTQSAAKIKRHNLASQQMAALVRKHGQGDLVSFFAGDVNFHDGNNSQSATVDVTEIFRANKLLTVWDENKVWPITRGSSTLDIIGRYIPDANVTNTRYKVWPKQNSDHSPISAWYDIKVGKPVSVGGGGNTPAPGNGGGGTGGDTPTSPAPAQDDFYATGGNVDWSDYFDGQIYYLPAAVADSNPTHGDLISD